MACHHFLLRIQGPSNLYWFRIWSEMSAALIPKLYSLITFSRKSIMAYLLEYFGMRLCLNSSVKNRLKDLIGESSGVRLPGPCSPGNDACA